MIGLSRGGVITAEEEGTAEEKREDPIVRIGYIGQDNRYWRVINTKLSDAYPPMRFLFFDYDLRDRRPDRGVIHRLRKNRVTILYVDLSLDTEEGVYLLRKLSSIRATKNIMLIALCSFKQRDQLIDQVIGAGAKALHLKSGEFFDAYHSAAALGFTQQANEVPYISVEIEHNDKVGELLQLSSIYKLGLAVEGNIEFQVGASGEFLHNIPTKVFSSRTFKVVGDKIDNHFYNYSHGYKLEPLYVDSTHWESVEVVKDEKGSEVEITTLDPEKIKGKKVYTTMVEREYSDDDLKLHRQQSANNFKTWIKHQEQQSLKVGVKVLVLDRGLSLLQHVPQSDLYENPTLFRFQALLEDPQEELVRYRPSLIIVRFEEAPRPSNRQADVKDGAVEEERPQILVNDQAAVEALIVEVKKIENYRPVILLFNMFDYTSVDLQKEYNYPKMMAMPVQIALDPILKLAERFRLQKSQDDYSDCPAPLLRPDRSESWIKYRHMVTIISLSESDIHFVCEEKMENFSVLFFEFPVKMLVTTTPFQDGSPFINTPNCYHGVISGVVTKEKQLLRRYINSICFKDVDEKNMEFVLQQGEVNQKFLDDLKKKQEEDRIAELEDKRNKWIEKLDSQIEENRKRIELFNEQALEEKMSEEEQDAHNTLVESNNTLSELKLQISNGEMDSQLDKSESSKKQEGDKKE
ncbi:MAG: hypothetical protein HN353_10070 [Bdellovibrionales bacterium]|jgi:hypothetical protein|nr:hypothetical protein [Bdellovibrionales bacterium]MBT3527246.1 hypothetical protein [Bdellovibrionales bacterium]MBT7669293.1 hypothetical protein [Bdellovibrionales bacterium]MBT7767862.1 hypothetical protein [Bdellovibrionales bacterium]